MRKLTRLFLAAVVAAACAVPATAGADFLRMGPFRDYVADKAYSDYLSTPDAEGWYLDRCARLNDHKVRCDANGTLAFTENGTSYTQDFLCWRTITRTIPPHHKRLRIRNSVSRRRCGGSEPVPV